MLSIFVALKIGISVDKFQTPLFLVEKLYLKLNTKLSLKAEKIHIFSQMDANSSLEIAEIQSVVDKLKYIYFFFESIEISHLQVGGENITLRLREKEFMVENPHFALFVSLERDGDLVSANIKELFFKGLGANLSGLGVVNTRTEQYDFVGEFSSLHTRFDFIVRYNPKAASIAITNIATNDIKRVMDYLETNKVPLPPSAYHWIGQGAAGKYYNFDFVDVELKFGKSVKIEMLDAKGYTEGLVVKLDESIADILIPRVDMNISKDLLDFDFEDANFAGYSIKGSKVFIYELTNPDKIGIDLHIVSSELPLGEKMLDLLKFYEINLPLKQIGGHLQSEFNMRIPFGEPENHSYNGKFEIEKAKITLADFFVWRGVVVLEQGRLFLQDFVVQNSFLQSEVNASIDILDKSGVFDARISRLFFEDVLDVKNQKISLNLDFKDEASLKIPAWDININFADGFWLQTPNLGRFKAYSKILQDYNISSVENFTIASKDMINFDVEAKNAHFSSDFFKDDAKTPYTNESFLIKKGENVLKIATESGIFSMEMIGNSLKINANDLFYRVKNTDNLGDLNYNIDLNATNSGILLENYDKTLHFDRLNFIMREAFVRANASKDSAEFTLTKDAQRLKLDITGLSDKNFNEFWRKDVVDGGEFALHINGASATNFEGQIVIKNTYIKGLRFHNQLVSFIDTIPSLVIFRTPTFNKKGLNVANGAVLFNKIGDIVRINALALDGDSVDVLGLGNINLARNTIKMELELKTLKATSDIIAKIPIINQVILGTDRAISTQIIVNGSLDEPKFNTQILKETLFLPFNLIKNIFEVPKSWER